MNDFETAFEDGELVNNFITERMFSTNEQFHATMHRHKRYNFSKPPANKNDNIKAPAKTTAMENKAFCEIIDLSEKCTEKVKLVNIMQHRVTDECLSIFNVNGTMVKVVKSKLVELLNFVKLPLPSECMALIDMGFIWRLATPTSEDREKLDESKYTWADYAKNILNMAMFRHKTASTVIFVCDPYDLETSIKDSEHERRSSTFIGGSKNVFMRRDDPMPTSRVFNALFNSPGNKMRLQLFLKEEFENLSSVYYFRLLTGAY